jgi:hypothetical protein
VHGVSPFLIKMEEGEGFEPPLLFRAMPLSKRLV